MREDNEDHVAVDGEDVPATGGYSFPIFTLWFVYCGLLVLIAAIASPWLRGLLHGLYLLIAVWYLRTAFSSKDYSRVKQASPGLTPISWKLNNLLFFVIIPLGVWVVLMNSRGWVI